MMMSLMIGSASVVVASIVHEPTADPSSTGSPPPQTFLEESYDTLTILQDQPVLGDVSSMLAKSKFFVEPCGSRGKAPSIMCCSTLQNDEKTKVRTGQESSLWTSLVGAYRPS
jgi:hypothetical protein